MKHFSAQSDVKMYGFVYEIKTQRAERKAKKRSSLAMHHAFS